MDRCERCPRFAALQAKLDDLCWLRDILDDVDDFSIAPDVHLNAQEKRILRAIMAASKGGRVASHAFLEDRLSSETENPHRTVSVYVSRLRGYLRPYDVEIQNVFGVGYRVDRASLNILTGDDQNT